MVRFSRFQARSQNLPPWIPKKERFNTLDTTINHVKLIDVFQNFTSVLVWYCHTLVQIYVVVYKVFQKLYRDVSRKVVIFRIGKYIYWSEMTACLRACRCKFINSWKVLVCFNCDRYGLSQLHSFFNTHVHTDRLTTCPPRSLPPFERQEKDNNNAC